MGEQTVTYAKTSPKMVNPRHIVDNAEEEEELTSEEEEEEELTSEKEELTYGGSRDTKAKKKKNDLLRERQHGARLTMVPRFTVSKQSQRRPV